MATNEIIMCILTGAMCVLTAVYVRATVLIYRSNEKSAKAAAEQLQEMKNIQQQNVNIQLYDKRHEVYYILWRWCDMSARAFNDLESPIAAFQEQLSYYKCNCEVFHVGQIIGSAKFLFQPLECGKAEEFRSAFIDVTYEMTPKICKN